MGFPHVWTSLNLVVLSCSYVCCRFRYETSQRKLEGRGQFLPPPHCPVFIDHGVWERNWPVLGPGSTSKERDSEMPKHSQSRSQPLTHPGAQGEQAGGVGAVTLVGSFAQRQRTVFIKLNHRKPQIRNQNSWKVLLSYLCQRCRKFPRRDSESEGVSPNRKEGRLCGLVTLQFSRLSLLLPTTELKQVILINPVWMGKGPHTNRTSSGEGSRGALQTQRPKVTT